MSEAILVIIILSTFIIIVLTIKAYSNVGIETDNLKYSVERLEDRISESYSQYNSISTKIKEYDRDIFEHKIRELCDSYKLVYVLEDQLVSTTETTVGEITYTCRNYSTILKIEAHSLSTDFLSELSKLCCCKLIETVGVGIINIKIKESKNEN